MLGLSDVETNGGIWERPAPVKRGTRPGCLVVAPCIGSPM